MVLLNLDVRLKSLTLPSLGRFNKHSSHATPPNSLSLSSGTNGNSVTNGTRATDGSNSNRKHRNKSAYSPFREMSYSVGESDKQWNKRNGSMCKHGSLHRTTSGDSVNSVSEHRKLSPSISEALLNYSIVGPQIQMSVQSCPPTPTGGSKLNQTLPADFQYGTPSSDGTPIRPLTRYRWSSSNIEHKTNSNLRRRLTINPSWKAGREVRRSRSFNAQPLTMATEVEQRGAQTPTESPTFSRKRHKPLVVKRISATDLEANQILAGYVERKCVSALWIRYWNVLHDGTLFCFLTSDDNVTVDALNLTGYTVTSLVDRFKGKRFVLELSHENFTSLYLSMESREEMSQWSECLNQAINRPSTDSPDVAQGACADCQNNRINDNDVDAKRKMVKQKLLEEVLRQKHELERKQAQRQKKQQGRNGLDSPDRAAPPDFLCDEQRTSNVTHLRQRRMSTQLKVETIQKQIEKPGGNKRGIFGFGKTKKLDENKNVFLQDQLKELNEKLHKIDSDLIQVDKHSESFDVNQNRKSMVVGSVTSPVMTSDRGHESDDDTNNAKTIKSAVQKWTNKTFSKTSGKKKPPQNGKINGSLSVPDMLFKTNGHVDLNGSLENGYQIDSDENSNPDFLESSVTDLTRPLSDLKLELSLPLNANTQQNGHSGSASPSSARYNRSNSRSSTLSSLSSPRREIDPSVLAQIDAFEELTKQVLGARSKDVPAK